MDLRDPTRKVFVHPGNRRFFRGTIANRNLNLISLAGVAGVALFGSLFRASILCTQTVKDTLAYFHRPIYLFFETDEPPLTFKEELIQGKNELVKALHKLHLGDPKRNTTFIERFRDIAGLPEPVYPKEKDY